MIRKRVLDKCSVIRCDPHHIKSAGRFSISITQKIKLCRPADPALLPDINCCCRLSRDRRGPVFHLHEYKIVSIPGYQIDFSAPAEKIPLKNPYSLFFQKGSRLLFMTTACFTFVNTLSLFSFCVSVSFVRKSGIWS